MNIKKDLVINSLKAIFESRRIPKMIQTDGGSQYRSHKFNDLMLEHRITHSMSAPETTDNAIIESFSIHLRKNWNLQIKETKVQMRILMQEY